MESAKISWDGATSPPSQDPPDPGKTQTAASVPKKTVSLEGFTPGLGSKWGPTCPFSEAKIGVKRCRINGSLEF